MADELGRSDVAENYLKLAGPSSREAEAENLWQEGEALLQRGYRSGVLRPFKRSYVLASDPHKASQITWMLGKNDRNYR